MSGRSYGIRYRVGERELYLHRNQLWASRETAERQMGELAPRGGRFERDEVCLVAVDAADLPPVAADEFEHAESRMLHWTTQVQRLRPGAELAMPRPPMLDEADVRDLRMFYEWLEHASRHATDPELVATCRHGLTNVVGRILAKVPR